MTRRGGGGAIGNGLLSLEGEGGRLNFGIRPTRDKRKGGLKGNALLDTFWGEKILEKRISSRLKGKQSWDAGNVPEEGEPRGGFAQEARCPGGRQGVFARGQGRVFLGRSRGGRTCETGESEVKACRVGENTPSVGETLQGHGCDARNRRNCRKGKKT